MKNPQKYFAGMRFLKHFKTAKKLLQLYWCMVVEVLFSPNG